ncbi:MAG: hypothetical protein M1830_010167 [Pleopsidium flavum]|nr:MAG: hypothetical protein M1830_010167 [Pleopsidium flavum]
MSQGPLVQRVSINSGQETRPANFEADSEGWGEYYEGPFNATRNNGSIDDSATSLDINIEHFDESYHEPLLATAMVLFSNWTGRMYPGGQLVFNQFSKLPLNSYTGHYGQVKGLTPLDVPFGTAGDYWDWLSMFTDLDYLSGALQFSAAQAKKATFYATLYGLAIDELYSDSGMPVTSIQIPRQGIITMSILLGIHSIVIVTMAIVAASKRTWTPHLDAKSMLLIGSQLSEDLRHSTVREMIDGKQRFVGNVAPDKEVASSFWVPPHR